MRMGQSRTTLRSAGQILKRSLKTDNRLSLEIIVLNGLSLLASCGDSRDFIIGRNKLSQVFKSMVSLDAGHISTSQRKYLRRQFGCCKSCRTLNLSLRIEPTGCSGTLSNLSYSLGFDRVNLNRYQQRRDHVDLNQTLTQ